MLIGRDRAEITLASAALHCAGARIVASRPDVVLVVEAKVAPPRRRGAPLVAIVPRHQKTKLLAAGVDAAYARPLGWKAYLRLVERVLSEWAASRTRNSTTKKTPRSR
jgi:hypothetical protein